MAYLATFSILSEIFSGMEPPQQRRGKLRISSSIQKEVNFKCTTVKNSIYGVYDIVGIRRLTKLRVEFSPLNEHKFQHNFDCLSPICASGCAIGDCQRFLLHCRLFSPTRIDLLGQLTDILGLNVTNFDSNTLCNLLLFESLQLNIVANRSILEATIALIDKTNRFD